MAEKSHGQAVPGPCESFQCWISYSRPNHDVPCNGASALRACLSRECPLQSPGKASCASRHRLMSSFAIGAQAPAIGKCLLSSCRQEIPISYAPRAPGRHRVPAGRIPIRLRRRRGFDRWQSGCKSERLSSVEDRLRTSERSSEPSEPLGAHGRGALVAHHGQALLTWSGVAPPRNARWG